MSHRLMHAPLDDGPSVVLWRADFAHADAAASAVVSSPRERKGREAYHAFIRSLIRDPERKLSDYILNIFKGMTPYIIAH